MCTICSSTLHATDVSDTGLLFEARCLRSFLKKGAGGYQSAGTLPVSTRENCYTRLSINESSSAAELRMKVGIPSGPAALCSFRSLSSWITPIGFITMFCIGECGLVLCLEACRCLRECKRTETACWEFLL